MELQISYSICAEISQESILQREMERDRKIPLTVMRVEGSKDNRSRSVLRSYPSIRRDTAEAIRIRIYGISEGKERCDDV